VEWEGQSLDLFSFNVLTVDDGQGLDLRELKLRYWDGKGDGYTSGPRGSPAEGGVW